MWEQLLFFYVNISSLQNMMTDSALQAHKPAPAPVHVQVPRDCQEWTTAPCSRTLLDAAI